MKIEFKWKISTGTFGSNGKSCWVGSVRVGTVHYNAIDGRSSGLTHISTCTLPQSNESKKFPTEKEAMEYIELSVRQWFDKLKLNK